MTHKEIPFMSRNGFRLLGALAILALSAGFSGCGDNSSGYVRVVHASVGAPNLAVQVADKFIVLNAPFGSYSEYVPVNTGDKSPVDIYAVSASQTPLLTTTANIAKDTETTIFVVNKVANLQAIIHPETDNSAPASGMFKLRAVQDASTAPSVDVYVTAPGVDITKIAPTIANVAFTSVSSYLSASAGTYQIRFTPVNTPGTVLIDSGAAPFAAGQIVSAIALDGTKAGTFSLLVADDTPPAI
jgi:Domain of unknown function (DUF4397)